MNDQPSDGRRPAAGRPRRAKAPEAADEAEILRFLTQVLRGEAPDAQLKDRFKAAEMLGARSGLFERPASAGATGSVTILDDLTGGGGA